MTTRKLRGLIVAAAIAAPLALSAGPAQAVGGCGVGGCGDGGNIAGQPGTGSGLEASVGNGYYWCNGHLALYTSGGTAGHVFACLGQP